MLPVTNGLACTLGRTRTSQHKQARIHSDRVDNEYEAAGFPNLGMGAARRGPLGLRLSRPTRARSHDVSYGQLSSECGRN
jgi:hypothetical protein